MRKMSRMISILSLVALVASAGPGSPAQDPARKDPPTIDAWWADLEKDEPEATRAVLKLAASPKETTAFLKAKMTPLTVDAARIQFLLTMLGDEKDEVWKPAFEELEYFDPRLAIGLEELMTLAPAMPTRQRMVEVLSGRPAGSLAGKAVDLRKFGQPEAPSFNFLSQPGGSWWAEIKVERLVGSGRGNPKKKWLRAVRAIAILESFGTPEAAEIIKAMATGHPDAQPTRFAKETLERIGVKAG